MSQAFKPTPSELEEIWAAYGEGEKLGVREKLIILSAVEISRVGIMEFNAKNPCAVIDAQSSIVNYYFDGREGLLAEAAYLVHKDWLKTVQSALSKKPSDPRKQLTAIMTAEMAYYRRWGEMAIFAAYPNSSPELRSKFFEKFHAASQTALEYYLAVLTVLIYDARKGEPSLIDFGLTDVPKSKLITHANAFLAATSLTWSIHGLGIWAAGQYVPSESIEDKKLTALTRVAAEKHHLKHIVDAAING